MSRPGAEAVPRLRPETRYRVVGGQAVVIVQDSGEALVLNEVGSRILELADGKRSIAEIFSRTRAEYEVETDVLEKDLEQYLGELVEAGILEINRPSPSEA